MHRGAKPGSRTAAHVQGTVHAPLRVTAARGTLRHFPGKDRLSCTERFVVLLAEFSDAYFEIFLKGTR